MEVSARVPSTVVEVQVYWKGQRARLALECKNIPRDATLGAFRKFCEVYFGMRECVVMYGGAVVDDGATLLALVGAARAATTLHVVLNGDPSWVLLGAEALLRGAVPKKGLSYYEWPAFAPPRQSNTLRSRMFTATTAAAAAECLTPTPAALFHGPCVATVKSSSHCWMIRPEGIVDSEPEPGCVGGPGGLGGPGSAGDNLDMSAVIHNYQCNSCTAKGCVMICVPMCAACRATAVRVVEGPGKGFGEVGVADNPQPVEYTLDMLERVRVVCSVCERLPALETMTRSSVPSLGFICRNVVSGKPGGFDIPCSNVALGLKADGFRTRLQDTVKRVYRFCGHPDVVLGIFKTWVPVESRRDTIGGIPHFIQSSSLQDLIRRVTDVYLP
jgi:hypothetical protein